MYFSVLESSQRPPAKYFRLNEDDISLILSVKVLSDLKITKKKNVVNNQIKYFNYRNDLSETMGF